MKVRAGSTSLAIPLFVQDTTSTTGGGLGSLVYNSAGLTAKYRREGDSAWSTITLATATVGTWSSGGFKEDSSGVTGTYEFGVPDAVLATGVRWAEVVLYGATNMLSIVLKFELDGQDLTAINNNTGGVAGLDRATRCIAIGTVTSGATTTSIPTSALTPAGSSLDQFKGRILTFDSTTTTAALRGESTDITGSSNAATPTFTVTALSATPASGDTFTIQ